jgi:hypothetical protein
LILNSVRRLTEMCSDEVREENSATSWIQDLQHHEVDIHEQHWVSS